MCAFHNEISSNFVAALNKSFEVGQLSSSQRESVILPIEKKRQG